MEGTPRQLVFARYVWLMRWRLGSCRGRILKPPAVPGALTSWSSWFVWGAFWVGQCALSSRGGQQTLQHEQIMTNFLRMRHRVGEEIFFRSRGGGVPLGSDPGGKGPEECTSCWGFFAISLALGFNQNSISFQERLKDSSFAT